MPKISVVGAGNVGASAALYLAEAEMGDVTLVDIVEGVAKGKALDLLEAGPVRGYDSMVEGSGDMKAVAGSELILVTAGLPRTRGMSRAPTFSRPMRTSCAASPRRSSSTRRRRS